MDRRLFLSETLKIAGLYTLSQLPLNVMAQMVGQEPRYLIAIRVSGSMHSLLAADPLPVDATKVRSFLKLTDRDWYVTYRDSELFKVGNNVYGQAADTLKDILPDVSVINGVMMLPRDSSHESNRSYFGTASADSYIHIATDFAKYLPQQPIGVVSEANMQGATQVNNLGSNIISTDEVAAELLADIAATLPEDGMAMTQKILVESRKKIDSFNKMFTASSGMQQGTDAQRRVIAAFNSGLSNVAVMEVPLDPQLDTHSDHARRHPQFLRQAFGTFSSLIKTLKATKAEASLTGKSLFDVTTVVMYTEFSRSAFDESRDGTAHNPATNSAWIAGGNIKGGMKVGGSDIIPASELNGGQGLSSLHALPFDFAKQQTVSLQEWSSGSMSAKFCTAAPGADCVDFIKPANVWATVYESMGINGGKLKGQRGLTSLIKK